MVPSSSPDIMDVAWSPDDSMFVSGSIDNNAIVWSVVKRNPIAKLEGHKNMIRGVAWDPCGEYIATEGDDLTVKIWRTRDWSLISTVTDPFVKAYAESHFARLGFDPMGSTLVASRGMRDKAHICPVIDRGSWTCDIEFAGHERPVGVARFSPCVYVGAQGEQFTVCALGGQDRRISIWKTGNPQGKDFRSVFNTPVMDIAWSSNGLVMLACSEEGTVVCMTFDKSELGDILPQAKGLLMYVCVGVIVSEKSDERTEWSFIDVTQRCHT